VTGTEIWKYAPAAPPPAPEPAAADPAAAGRGGAPPQGRGGRGGRGGGRFGDSAGTALRGPTYWAGTAEIGPRIYSTTGPGLAAIDAKTGKLVTTFGVNGVLPGITPPSPPAIYRNVLIAHG